MSGNVVYSNAVGITGEWNYSGAILNNVVYSNTTSGILLSTANGALVTNNTVYQPTGDAVRVTDNSVIPNVIAVEGSRNVTLKNNILWAQSGYAIYVSNNSQQGFNSDYNLLRITGSGKVGFFQSEFVNLRDWQLEVGQDANSIGGDPLFLNINGPDGVLGFDYGVGVDRGADDDFRLRAGAPAIDRGDPTSNFSTEPLPNGGRIDIGAYGNTAEATRSAVVAVFVGETDGSTDVAEAGNLDSYSVVLTSPPTADVVVTLHPDSQLTVSLATLTFTAANWNVAQSVTVRAVDDTVRQGDRTRSITHTASSTDSRYNGVAVGAVAAHISDNEPGSLLPLINIAAAPATVSEDGTGKLVFTFTRVMTTGPLTVSFDVGGTATLNGSDYTTSGAASFSASSGTVTFADGSATAAVTVDPSADTTYETDETVILSLQAGAGYSLGTQNSVTGTITNDDTSVTIAVSPATVTEDGTPNLVYTFTRSGATSGALTVSFSVGGTATITTDYAPSGAATFTASSGTVSFAAGITTKTVTIDPTADTTIEDDETVVLAVTPMASYSVGVANSATGTILNDDLPIITVAVSPASVTENGSTNSVFTFTRPGPTTSALTVNFSVGGSAEFNSDYTVSGATTFTASAGTVTFAAGQATKTVIVDPTGDTTFEPNDFVGTLTPVVATITNDDQEVSVTVSPASVTEDGTANLLYTFTRVGATTAALTANFAVGGTATSAVDYVQSGAATFTTSVGTVSFSAGQTTKVVTINPTTDTVIEPDELVVLTLTATANYSVGTAGTATGTILNDDPRITLVVTPASVVENGPANTVYAFTRTGPTTSELTVNFNVGGTATFGTDYAVIGATSFGVSDGVVTFAAGQATKTVIVDPTGDTTFEPNETVALTIAAASSYFVGTLTPVVATITNDDQEVSVTVSPASVTEDGTANLLYTFTRVGATTTALTVSFTVGGTATFSSDYTQTGAATFSAATGGTISFAAGQTTKVVTINPTGDTLVELDETVILTVTSRPTYSIGTAGAATGTISNDDGVGSLSAVFALDFHKILNALP
ncbi:MAG: right-handed parallel beta-helix repeat-containing protein [Planctomycetia bacterium]|nr:right-handed parallel beta-helix repeat-containing protein [Planctomycetia bacterium]